MRCQQLLGSWRRSGDVPIAVVLSLMGAFTPTLVVLVSCTFSLAQASPTARAFPCATAAECTQVSLWHIPGPNPIVSPWNPDGKADWMSSECEVAGGVQKVNASTYVFVYHCLGTSGYRVGMSTASSPLGPWTKPPQSPVLDVTPHAWDSDVVASFNILPDPEKPGAWLGYFEGGMPADGKEDWSMGVARAPSPLGPWSKSPKNPILDGNLTCDPSREFTGQCGGLYVASVMHGPHTDNEYWVYVEAPINENDEGPIALWTAKEQDGPFSFKAYVLDGGVTRHPKGAWDYGRYSESKVVYFGGLFHIFATASPIGGPHENKLHEQIGWAVSSNGVNFTEHPHNPVAPVNETTPQTVAMSEGHVWFEEARPASEGSEAATAMVYVYHTIRWVSDAKSTFAPAARNAEDLGVEIFSASANFTTSRLPLITPHWELQLQEGDASPCQYDWVHYRYCAQIKTVIRSSSEPGRVLKPRLLFAASAHCAVRGAARKAARAKLQIFAFSKSRAAVGKLLHEVELEGGCGADGRYHGKAALSSAKLGEEWVVAKVVNTGGGALAGVELGVVYSSDGTLHEE